MHDNITLNEFIYVYLVKIAGPTNYKQTRAWRYSMYFVQYVFVYTSGRVYISNRATEPYSSGTCTFNVLLLMQCSHLCFMCANHTYNAHIHTSTLEHFEYYNMHDQYCHNICIPCDHTTWCEEKEGRHHVHAVTCYQLGQWVQHDRHTPQITSWRELVIIQIIVKPSYNVVCKLTHYVLYTLACCVSRHVTWHVR